MTNEEIKKRRRENILEAALKCFVENGYYKTSMATIADRANITKRGLYYHFRSKDQLFIDLFHYRGKQYFQQVNSHIQKITDPEKKARLFVSKASHMTKHNEDFLRFFIEFMSVGTRNPAVCEVMTKYYRDSIMNFAKLLEAGGKLKKIKKHDQKKIARIVYLLSMGTFFTHFSLDTDYDLVTQHAFNLNIVLKDIFK